MTEYDFDWDALAKNAGAYDPLPADIYPVEVVETTPTVNRSGNQMLKVRFEIESGPHAGRKLWNNFNLMPENSGAMFHWFKSMDALGLTKEWFVQTRPGIDAVGHSLLGRRARISVDLREYQGVMRNEVKEVLPPLAPTVTAPAQPAAPPQAVVQPPAVAPPTAVVSAPQQPAATPPVSAPPALPTVDAPDPVTPVVTAPPVAETPAQVATAPATPLPPGMSAEQFAAFQAWQAQQQQQVTTPQPVAVAPPEQPQSDSVPY